MYIATQRDNPVPGGTGLNYVKVCQAAQNWANYSKQRVHVIEVKASCMADTILIVLPEKENT